MPNATKTEDTVAKMSTIPVNNENAPSVPFVASPRPAAIASPNREAGVLALKQLNKNVSTDTCTPADFERLKQKATKKALLDLEKQILIREAVHQKHKKQAMQDFIVTSPESKHFVFHDDNQKPLFKRGEFVKVSRDFSPGKNRQEGYGFIESVAGVGSATICSVQMVPHGDDGPRLHKGLTVDEITIEIFHQYL